MAKLGALINLVDIFARRTNSFRLTGTCIVFRNCKMRYIGQTSRREQSLTWQRIWCRNALNLYVWHLIKTEIVCRYTSSNNNGAAIVFFVFRLLTKIFNQNTRVLFTNLTLLFRENLAELSAAHQLRKQKFGLKRNSEDLKRGRIQLLSSEKYSCLSTHVT